MKCYKNEFRLYQEISPFPSFPQPRLIRRGEKEGFNFLPLAKGGQEGFYG